MNGVLKLIALFLVNTLTMGSYRETIQVGRRFVSVFFSHFNLTSCYCEREGMLHVTIIVISCLDGLKDILNWFDDCNIVLGLPLSVARVRLMKTQHANVVFGTFCLLKNLHPQLNQDTLKLAVMNIQ